MSGGGSSDCPECGRPVDPATQPFCPNCGYPLMFKASETPASSSPIGHEPGTSGQSSTRGDPHPPVQPDDPSRPSCPRCGYSSHPSRVRCERCGAALGTVVALVELPPGPPAPHPRLARDRWLLLVIGLGVLAILLVLALIFTGSD